MKSETSIKRTPSGPSQVSAWLIEVGKIAQCLLTINIQRLLRTVIKFHVATEAIQSSSSSPFITNFNLFVNAKTLTDFSTYFKDVIQYHCTLKKLWRVWKIGRLVFVSVPSIFLVVVAKQVPGVAYIWQHVCKETNPFYFTPAPPPPLHFLYVHRHTVWAWSEGQSQGITVSSSFCRKTGNIRPASSAEGSISQQQPS